MPKPTKGARLGGGPAHERLMLANLASQLFEHGAITTTVAKAKRVRPLAERMITFAKRGDLASRRRVLTVIRDKAVVHELFTEIGPRYDTRPGGYTRITKLGPRKGDNAPMARIELVEALSEEAIAEAEGAAKRAAKERKAKESEVDKPKAAPESDATDEGLETIDEASEEAVDEVIAKDADEATEAKADAKAEKADAKLAEEVDEAQAEESAAVSEDAEVEEDDAADADAATDAVSDAAEDK